MRQNEGIGYDNSRPNLIALRIIVSVFSNVIALFDFEFDGGAIDTVVSLTNIQR